MDRLDTMRVFLAVAEARGFAKASRRLALSPAVVTRAILALEQRLGVKLLQRTTRVVRLTEAGARYLTDCQRILGDLARSEEALAARDAAPRGALTLTASRIFGRMFVTPVLLDFLERYDEISLRAVFDDHVIDLVEAGIDVAVRIGALADSSLTAIRVGTVRRVFCASPAYLARRGTPARPTDLEDHEALVFAGATTRSEWTLGSGRAARTVRPRAVVSTNDADAIIAAALAGRGIARLVSYQIGPQVASGRLVRLDAFDGPAIPVSVVCPAGRRGNARVRSFVDFAVPALRAASWLS